MSELEALTIDRSRPRPRARRGAGLGRWIALALALLALWLFRAPILSRIDRWRLLEVGVLTVREASALSAGALAGTSANGYVVAAVRAALSADTPGRIVEMNVTEGSVVKAGDVVARLYSDEYAADLRRAEAALTAAEAGAARAAAERDVAGAEVARIASEAAAAVAAAAEAEATARLAAQSAARIEQLVAAGVESAQRLDDALAERQRAAAAKDSAARRAEAASAAVASAERDLAAREAALAEAHARIPVAEAERQRARATLDKTEVRAPFDGVVVLKDAEVGEVVSPNAVGSQSRGSVVTMVDFASLEVQVEVPETSLTAVALGARAQIFLDAYPSEPYAGRVERIWPTANRQKATIEVRVAFERTAPSLRERLRPEMGARVVFAPAGAEPSETPAAEPGILIPTACLISVDGQRGVFVLERDVVAFRPLELGAERGERVQALAGLSAGERVVLEPPARLAPGARVLIKE